MTWNGAKFGSGVYDLTEAARYTHLNYERVRSWFRGRSDGHGHGAVFRGDYTPVENDYAISFHDLVDLLLAGRFREEGISMPVMRAAYDALSEDMGVHPFCRKDLWTDGSRIFLCTANTIGNEALHEVVSRQQFFPKVIRPYLTQLRYDESDLAHLWHIAPSVVLNPSVALGKPTVEGTGVTTFVVARAVAANHDNEELVADLFNLDVRDVCNAAAFERRLRHGRAA